MMVSRYSNEQNQTHEYRVVLPYSTLADALEEVILRDVAQGCVAKILAEQAEEIIKGIDIKRIQEKVEEAVKDSVIASLRQEFLKGGKQK